MPSSSKKEILDRDPHWFETNIMGSGPFRFKEYQTGPVDFRRANPDYYRPGLPISMDVSEFLPTKQAVRWPAIRGDRAAIEFRGFSAGDARRIGRLRSATRSRFRKSDWNCGNPNHP